MPTLSEHPMSQDLRGGQAHCERLAEYYRELDRENRAHYYEDLGRMQYGDVADELDRLAGVKAERDAALEKLAAFESAGPEVAELLRGAEILAADDAGAPFTESFGSRVRELRQRAAEKVALAEAQAKLAAIDGLLENWTSPGRVDVIDATECIDELEAALRGGSEFGPDDQGAQEGPCEAAGGAAASESGKGSLGG